MVNLATCTAARLHVILRPLGSFETGENVMIIPVRSNWFGGALFCSETSNKLFKTDMNHNIMSVFKKLVHIAPLVLLVATYYGA